MSSLFSSLIPGATIRGKPLVVVSPYDGTEIATCETADFAAADVALKIAHSLYLNRDRWIPLPERLSILEQAMAIIRSRAPKPGSPFKGASAANPHKARLALGTVLGSRWGPDGLV